LSGCSLLPYQFVFYDGVVVPGVVILFVPGAWMIAESWGGSGFVQHPWLAGIILLFVVRRQ
jgi:hypothetical protein